MLGDLSDYSFGRIQTRIGHLTSRESLQIVQLDAGFMRNSAVFIMVGIAEPFV